jgi:hypothetical protein
VGVTTSKRDDQQRVDLLTVGDDEALDEAVGLARQVDAVEMASRDEEAHLAMVDDRRDRNEVRAHLRDAVGDRVHPDRADDMTITVRFEDLDAAQHLG